MNQKQSKIDAMLGREGSITDLRITLEVMEGAIRDRADSFEKQTEVRPDALSFDSNGLVCQQFDEESNVIFYLDWEKVNTFIENTEEDDI